MSYDDEGRCVLTEEEKEKFTFIRRACGHKNSLNTIKICNEYTPKILKRKIDGVTNGILNKIETERKKLEFKTRKSELEIKFTKLQISKYNRGF